MKDKALSFKLGKGSFQEPFLEKMIKQELEDQDVLSINKADKSYLYISHYWFNNDNWTKVQR